MPSYEFLSRLFWACSDEAKRPGLNLDALYERMEETEQADASIAAAVTEELADPLAASQIAHEKQGFINGFRICSMMYDEVRKEESK